MEKWLHVVLLFQKLCSHWILFNSEADLHTLTWVHKLCTFPRFKILKLFVNIYNALVNYGLDYLYYIFTF